MTGHVAHLIFRAVVDDESVVLVRESIVLVYGRDEASALLKAPSCWKGG